MASTGSAYGAHDTRARATQRRHAPAGVRPRVRWDRLGRLALLVVLATLVYLYVSAGSSLLSTWSQAKRDTAKVTALAREHTRLEQARAHAGTQAAVEAQARRLGMVRPGEQPYVLNHLPQN